MAKNFLLRWLHRYGDRQRTLGVNRCDDWGGREVDALAPESLLDVGCGDGGVLFKYLKKIPRDFHGVEGAPLLKAKAEQRGLKVASFDLNGRWPYEDNRFDVVFSSQVIEHLHNSRLFVEEIYRVLKPGGTAVVSSENLCSLLNWLALSLGYTPFSLMQTCGRYLGNPLGMHYQEPHESSLPIEHPAYSGVTGHVRVMTVRQARELFELTGFGQVEARSIGILPLPDWLSRALEGIVKHRGHFLLIKAKKATANER